MKITMDTREVSADTRALVIAEDGNTMFEIVVNEDGRSVTCRSLDHCTVAGVRYSASLDVRPLTSNAVELRVRDKE